MCGQCGAVHHRLGLGEGNIVGHGGFGQQCDWSAGAVLGGSGLVGQGRSGHGTPMTLPFGSNTSWANGLANFVVKTVSNKASAELYIVDGKLFAGPCAQGVLDPVMIPCPMSQGCDG